MARTWRNLEKTKQRRFKSKEKEARLIQCQIREDLQNYNESVENFEMKEEDTWDMHFKQHFEWEDEEETKQKMEKLATELLKLRNIEAKRIIENKMFELYNDHCLFGLGDLSHTEFTFEIVKFLEALLIPSYSYF